MEEGEEKEKITFASITCKKSCERKSMGKVKN